MGTVGLVFYTFPYLGILFVPLTIAYYGFAMFYRRTSVETKRLDSLMRSSLYAAYSGKPAPFNIVPPLLTSKLPYFRDSHWPEHCSWLRLSRALH